MPRRRRNPPGGYVYHVLNRSNRRETLFSNEHDYIAFLEVVREALISYPMRIIEFCVMPNHWHFQMWPELDGQLAAFMGFLTTTHAARWNRFRNLTGHVYQGPYKSFPIAEDDHYYTVARYIVRNPLRANLVSRAEDWPWSSLHACTFKTQWTSLLSAGPFDYPTDWLQFVNRPQTESELAAIRQHVQKGTPFGSDEWAQRTAKSIGIEESMRGRGQRR